jgi:magnesium chelatase family protein
MYAAIRSATLLGTRGAPIVVESHVGVGIPAFTVVGLPDEGCRESRDRVRAALLSSGLEWPNRRITINLAGTA